MGFKVGTFTLMHKGSGWICTLAGSFLFEDFLVLVLGLGLEAQLLLAMSLALAIYNAMAEHVLQKVTGFLNTE